MNEEIRRRARRDLDEDLRLFRGSSVRRSKWGWLRGVRQALGMRVEEVAGRLKVGHSEIYRLEMSEVRETITLRKLRATAEAMGCEVVYAVIPMRGTLEDLAEAHATERSKSKTAKRQRLSDPDPYGLTKTFKAVLTPARWNNGPSGERRRR